MKFVKIVINGEELYRRVDGCACEGSADFLEISEGCIDGGCDGCEDKCERTALDTDISEDSPIGEKICGTEPVSDESAAMPQSGSGVRAEAERLLSKVVSGAKNVWGKIDGKARDIAGRFFSKTDNDKK